MSIEDCTKYNINTENINDKNNPEVKKWFVDQASAGLKLLEQHKKNISNEEFFKLLNDSDIIKIMDPKPDASFVTNELHQRGYQIVFVTARGWHSDMVKITTEWLQKHDIYYDQVEFVHVGESKLGKIKGYKNVKLIIEDNVKHILELRDNGYHTVAVDGSWNKSVPEPRIESLSEILEILE